MVNIKFDFWFTFFERENAEESMRFRTENMPESFDFGSNYAYFLVLSEVIKDLRASKNTLKSLIEGNYCLINILYEKEPSFFVGISMDWLTNQVGNIPDLDDIIHKVLTKWSDQHSLFTVRHVAFCKQHQRVVNQDLLTKSYFFQFFHFFVEDIQAAISSRNAADFREMDLRKIREIEEKITYNFHKSTPSISEMAKMAGMSVSKFKSLFYELYSTTPHQYILDKKMMYAKGLLQTGRYSVTQVAYKVGYHHPSGFTRVYKQKFNHSPNTTYFEH
jgi:AraC family transcriptional regulator, exoenzyme S synthesis regulatory protein ExsA